MDSIALIILVQSIIEKNELEEMMLLNLHKAKWTEGLHVPDFNEHTTSNKKSIESMRNYTKDYQKAINDEEKMTKEKLIVHKVGKLDAKKHLEIEVLDLMGNNITQSLGIMLNTITF